jgi:hypothetical protein
MDTAMKTGKEHDGSAIIYCATSQHYGTPLIILDYDLVQIKGGLLADYMPSVFQRLDELAVRCRARMGSAGVWIEDAQSGTILIQQGEAKGWPTHAIDTDFTASGKDARALSVSGYVHQEKVKLSAYANDKIVNFKGSARNHLVSQITGFHIGDKEAAKRADDLLDAFVYSVAISLGNNQGY